MQARMSYQGRGIPRVSLKLRNWLLIISAVLFIIPLVGLPIYRAVREGIASIPFSGPEVVRVVDLRHEPKGFEANMQNRSGWLVYSRAASEASSSEPVMDAVLRTDTGTIVLPKQLATRPAGKAFSAEPAGITNKGLIFGKVTVFGDAPPLDVAVIWFPKKDGTYEIRDLNMAPFDDRDQMMESVDGVKGNKVYGRLMKLVGRPARYYMATLDGLP